MATPYTAPPSAQAPGCAWPPGWIAPFFRRAIGGGSSGCDAAAADDDADDDDDDD